MYIILVQNFTLDVPNIIMNIADSIIKYFKLIYVGYIGNIVPIYSKIDAIAYG